MRFLHRPPRAEGPAWPVLDESEVSWIRDGRRPFADLTVGSLVPVGFERYVRILHPAWAHARRPWVDPPVAIRWSTVARWSGRQTHALVQWAALAQPVDDRPVGACPFDHPPMQDGLPPDLLNVLCEHLEQAGAPDRCFLARWEGYWGGSGPWKDGKLLALDQRAYLVVDGPLAHAAELAGRHDREIALAEPPTLLWPDDRAWFVATDPDLDSTYVGGAASLIEAILGDDRLETWPAAATDDISAASDRINR